MSLKDLDFIIKNEYRSLNDNVVQDFYIPLLKEANFYRRAVGFFSSTALIEISKGIGNLAARGGKIQIIASPYLSDEDLSAIKEGYEKREKIIEGALLRALSDEYHDYYSMQRLNLLANLIAEGILDIKIAYTTDESGIGMYHEKTGIIEDLEGNIVAFSGSMNESRTAMTFNYETIDVFCNWRDLSESNRITQKCKAFYNLWNNINENFHEGTNKEKIIVCDFPSISETMIERYRKSPPNFRLDEEQFKSSMFDHNILHAEKNKVPIGARIPEDIELHQYQKDAITNWVADSYRGIFDMATGTGKTYTGLGAISKLSEELNDRLAVIILCPYQHLVEQWVEDIVRFNIKPIIGYSSSPQKEWKRRLSKAISDQNLRVDKKFFCFICTNATFTNTYVQDQINRIKTPILLVVDEAHNVGAQSFKKLLDYRFDYCLGLSATIERHRDQEGTNFLEQFFGKVCITYTLEQAISENKLTPYMYYPVLVYLTADELEKYEYYSREISKNLICDKTGNYRLNKHGEMLALQRSRIIAGAQQKLSSLREKIEPYVKDNYIIVYCGATNIQAENIDIDDSEIRQIEAVTRLLGNDLDMKVTQFTSKEDIETRAIIKDKFQKGQLQAVVAIKCLDEGVNIPGIRTAFILASTTNPKEYIQRRGRVLRKAPNKDIAEIYDFVTLPRPLDEVSSLTEEQIQRDKALVKRELARIMEFGRLAKNSMDANTLIWDIKNTYKLNDEQIEGDIVYE